MNKTGLTVHVIVRNEEQWIWYAINSVLPFSEKIIIYDTGSTDRTIELIHLIKSDKIIFKPKGRVTPQELAKLRNEQIKETETDWFLLLDGDEVWPEKSIIELTQLIVKAKKDVIGVVVKALLPVGDLFHYQSEMAGKYELLGKKGHLNMRVYRKTPKYHWEAVPPYTAYVEKYVNSNNVQVQDIPQNLTFLKNEYWHLTHLIRSTVDTHYKRKYEIGKYSKRKIPEVFYKPRPSEVPTPWVKFSTAERILAFFLYLKRKFI